MTSSLIIDNYNYSPFLVDCVRSALQQKRPFDEIIVVDDGSTDESRQLLQALKAESPLIKIIEKENGGQLSAFIAGIEAARCDTLFFLDSDDVLRVDHHLSMAACMDANPAVGMVFSAYETIGSEQKIVTRGTGALSLGLTVIPTYAEACFIGNITSTLGIRRNVLTPLLPVFKDLAPLWRTRADDCLVLGASLTGAIKFSTDQPTVYYRIHQANAFAKQAGSPTSDYQHYLRRKGFVRRVSAQLGLDESIYAWADVEYFTAPQRERELRLVYRRSILASKLPLWQKIKKCLKLALSAR